MLLFLKSCGNLASEVNLLLDFHPKKSIIITYQNPANFPFMLEIVNSRENKNTW